MASKHAKSTLGILADPNTDEVPGTVLLFEDKVEPLGLDSNRPISPSHPSEIQGRSDPKDEAKRTSDGIILDPQPDDHPDDPLNWAPLRRDLALLSLGWHCLVGGGQTPILAAGFNDVAKTYSVTVPDVALTTGLFMLGLGFGSLFASPLAILYGKRPVYLGGAFLFLVAALWCAASKSYVSLVLARIVMGLGVSPCECLPSATIAEIFFLHERAYRVGIYTLLLLGGKNLVPIVSAAIIQTIGWRWVFWIVAIVVGFNLVLLFLFVPETFWDRTPRPKSHRPSMVDRLSSLTRNSSIFSSHRLAAHARSKPHIGEAFTQPDIATLHQDEPREKGEDHKKEDNKKHAHFDNLGTVRHSTELTEKEQLDGYQHDEDHGQIVTEKLPSNHTPGSPMSPLHSTFPTLANLPGHDPSHPKHIEPKSFKQQLSPWNGRIRKDRYLKVMLRPVVLYAYPAVLWSTVVYSLSIGWLIVMSESVAHIYQKNPYNFSRLSTGLVYISPFIGGILGTAVAGKASDVIVRFMARRNGGVYEPEFRLVMAIPLTLATAIGLMGYGWSAYDHDKWIVPTVFFGIISFGCSLGSTTAITYTVDCYRQYAGEALVTLNFSKNVFHGFVFSLFFNRWLDADGSRTVFIGVGAIHVACLLATIPMYIYGKRARSWTQKRNFMSRL